MTKFTDKEFSQLRGSKRIIIDKCKVKGCNSGFFESGKKCECLILFEWVQVLTKSNIEKVYWNKKLEDLSIKPAVKLYIKKYMRNISNAINNSMGFTLLGMNGVGKTTIMSIVGIYALINQYNVFHIRTSDILKDIFEKNEIFKSRLDSANIIVVDELDKVYMKNPEWTTFNLDVFFREYLRSKSILIASNWEEKEIEEEFGPSIFSLLTGVNEFMNIEGRDHRRIRGENWLDRLEEEEVNFNDLKEDSQLWYKNKIEKLKKEYDEVIG